MNWSGLRQELQVEARVIFKNPELALSDIRGWGSNPKITEDGEVAAFLPHIGLWVAVPEAADKRA